jgi:hypothetical protein
MAQVGRIASGYVYYVSLKGVTGAGHLDTDAVAAMLPRIRAHVPLPLGVGFGIRDAATAQAVARVADAVVIGSRLVQILQNQPREEVWPAPPGPSWPRSARPWTRAEGRRQGDELARETAAAEDPADRSDRAPHGARGSVDQVPGLRDGALQDRPRGNLNVCPKCSHHHRIGARARLDAFLDAEGRYEIGQEVLPVDALKFKRQQEVPRTAEGGAGVHRRDRRA